MPVEVPTIADVQADIITKIENTFSITIPALPQKSFFRSFASVLAGPIWLLYKYGQRILLNLLPSTADGDQLDNIGEMFGNELLRIKAENFIGTATFTRVGGTTGDILIQSGTILKNSAGATYYVIGDTTLLDGNPTVVGDIQSEESGEIAALAVGATITLYSSIVNLQDTATIATITQQASDEESNDDYRVRLVERFSLRPQGGAKPDYVGWAKASDAGVTRVFPYSIGFSTGRIYFLRDNDGDENGDRIPDSTEIATVYDYVTDSSRLPVGTFLYVMAPTERIFRLEIYSSVTLTTSEKARLKTAAVNYFNSKVMYVDDNLSNADDALVNKYILMSQLVQISSYITNIDIDEVGGASSIAELTLSDGDVGFLDSTVDITYTVV